MTTQMMEFCIRAASDDDTESLIALYRLSLSRLHGVALATIARDEFFRGTQDETLLVAMDAQSGLVGMLSYDAADSFIHHLYVDPECQGRGVGKALLHALSLQLSRPWQLKCLANNRDALAFYGSLGWRKISNGVTSQGEYFLLELI